MLIEDEDDILPPKAESKPAPQPVQQPEDDIVIIEDEEPEAKPIAAETSAQSVPESGPSVSADTGSDSDIIIEDEEDELGIFDSEDEDDFLIVEEEARTR